MTGMDPKLRQGLDDLLTFVRQEIEQQDTHVTRVRRQMHCSHTDCDRDCPGAVELERQIVELAHKLRADDENEALMAGTDVPGAFPPLTAYLERAATLLEASE